MKKITFVLSLFLIFLFAPSVLGAEEEVTLSFLAQGTLLNAEKVAAFNEKARAHGFRPFNQEVFPGFRVETRTELPKVDLNLSTNTTVAGGITKNDEKELIFMAVGITFSLEKEQPLGNLTAHYGGTFGYGISTLSARFGEDGSLDDQLSAANLSQALEFYLLVGPKASLSYYLTEKMALVAQAQYLVPLGSWGTEGFSLPLGGPGIALGLSFDLP